MILIPMLPSLLGFILGNAGVVGGVSGLSGNGYSICMMPN